MREYQAILTKESNVRVIHLYLRPAMFDAVETPLSRKVASNFIHSLVQTRDQRF